MVCPICSRPPAWVRSTPTGWLAGWLAPLGETTTHNLPRAHSVTRYPPHHRSKMASIARTVLRRGYASVAEGSNGPLVKVRV